MGGFFGAVSRRDVTLDVFFGVDYHSHLGTKRGGIALLGEKGFERQIHSIENTPFLSEFRRRRFPNTSPLSPQKCADGQ